MELLTWLPCLLLTILSLYLLTTVSPAASKRRLLLPPGPPALPIVGNLLLLGDQPHRALARLAKVHGPVMALKLGLTTTVVVSSPEAAKEVLQKKDKQLSNRWVPDAAHVLGHNEHSIIWQSTTPLQKQLRSICITKLFSSRGLESSRQLRQEKVRELVAYFRAHAGRPVDVGRAAFGATLNLISNTIFSIDMADLTSEKTNEFRDLVSKLTEESGKPNVSDFFPVLRRLDLQGRRRRIEFYLSKLFSIFQVLIDRRLSSKSTASTSSDDFLDYLMDLCADSKLDRKTIKSFLADLFAAGTDTTSITLEWAMAELLRNPRTMTKAQAELDEVIGSRTEEVEESDIAKLPYLQAVLKEVLRLHPAGPLLLPHEVAEEGVELGGYPVPRGTRVLVNAWAIGRDEEVWPEPDEFKPERFLEKEVDFQGRDFELIPFGSGRRSCPAMPLAARTMHLVLASLLHAFEWKLPEGMVPEDLEMKERFGFTLAMAAPLQAAALPIRRHEGLDATIGRKQE